MCRHDPDDGKENAASALGAIASHERGKAAVVAANAVPALVRLLGSPNPHVAQNAAYAIGALCASPDDETTRKLVADAGAIELLVRIAKRSPLDLARQQAAGALWNVANSRMAIDVRERCVKEGAVEALVDLERTGETRESREWATIALESLAWRRDHQAADLEELIEPVEDPAKAKANAQDDDGETAARPRRDVAADDGREPVVANDYEEKVVARIARASKDADARLKALERAKKKTEKDAQKAKAQAKAQAEADAAATHAPSPAPAAGEPPPPGDAETVQGGADEPPPPT